jgi:methyl-accepting chemotaxis protein
MKNASLSVKLIGGFMIVACLLLVGGFSGWYSVNLLSKHLLQVNTGSIPFIRGLAMISEARISIQKFEYGMLIPEFVKDDGEKAQQMSNLEKKWKMAEQGFNMIDPLPRTKEETEIWNNFKSVWENWRKENSQVLELAKTGKREEAIASLTSKEKRAAENVEKLLDDLVSLNMKLTEEKNKSAAVTERWTKIVTSIGTGLGVVVTVLLGIFFARYITKPINSVIKLLTESTDHVTSASREVAAASQSLAQGASEQASSIEESSSSLEEMAAMTKQNAGNAEHANKIMSHAEKSVSAAAESMKDLISSMKDISSASEEISKIINTIDGIAFQTNLLALNAAVEAARAGEAGAGFAVVAEEVRNLAMRSAEAARSTAALIEGTVKKIHESSDLVGIASQTFTEVARGADKVGELIRQISAGSKEQAQGIEQLNRAVAEMDKVTQQTAANAEQSAATAEEMNAQAEQIAQIAAMLVNTVGSESVFASSAQKRLIA